MKKVFIAYANDAMAYSLKRIGRQAKKLRIFDDIILYTPHDLPDYAKKCELMQYSYGGGYWAWKPIIIWETLQKYEEGTIVCYIDAGCTLKKGIEWTLYFELMREYNFLCFKYRDSMPCWKKFGSESTHIKHWVKKESILFYNQLTGSQEWLNENKIWGGAIFAKGQKNILLHNWVDIILNHSEIIKDPQSTDDQYPFFAQHKHDQPLLVALTHKYHQDAIVLPELCETCGDDVAIFASRVRAKTLTDYILLKMKLWGRKLLGKYIYESIKNKVILR